VVIGDAQPAAPTGGSGRCPRGAPARRCGVTGGLAAWAKRFEAWAEGGEPTDLPRLTSSGASANGRDCFVYFISGAKVRAPAAAKAFMAQLRAP
jgi:hypothetical protein